MRCDLRNSTFKEYLHCQGISSPVYMPITPAVVCQQHIVEQGVAHHLTYRGLLGYLHGAHDLHPNTSVPRISGKARRVATK